MTGSETTGDFAHGGGDFAASETQNTQIDNLVFRENRTFITGRGGGDSLWAEVVAAAPVDVHGHAEIDGAVHLNLVPNGEFLEYSVGEWNVAEGVHTIRVSMRESGAAFSALRFLQVPTPSKVVDSVLELQAEDFDRRSLTSHLWPPLYAWQHVPRETPGVGDFSRAAGGEWMERRNTCRR